MHCPKRDPFAREISGFSNHCLILLQAHKGTYRRCRRRRYRRLARGADDRAAGGVFPLFAARLGVEAVDVAGHVMDAQGIGLARSDRLGLACAVGGNGGVCGIAPRPAAPVRGQPLADRRQPMAVHVPLDVDLSDPMSAPAPNAAWKYTERRTVSANPGRHKKVAFIICPFSSASNVHD